MINRKCGAQWVRLGVKDFSHFMTKHSGLAYLLWSTDSDLSLQPLSKARP